MHFLVHFGKIVCWCLTPWRVAPSATRDPGSTPEIHCQSIQILSEPVRHWFYSGKMYIHIEFIFRGVLKIHLVFLLNNYNCSKICQINQNKIKSFFIFRIHLLLNPSQMKVMEKQSALKKTIILLSLRLVWIHLLWPNRELCLSNVCPKKGRVKVRSNYLLFNASLKIPFLLISRKATVQISQRAQHFSG